MYEIMKLATFLEENGIGVKGETIFIGRFEDEQEGIMLSQEAGFTSENIVGSNLSTFDQDVITIRVVFNENYIDTQNKANDIYKLFRENNVAREIGIINSTISQPILVERVKGKLYKFNLILDITYKV